MNTFTVDGVEYPLVSLEDSESLTLGEMELLEETSGASLSDFSEGKVSARAMIGLVLVSMRRVDPEATLDMARRVRVTDLAKLGEDDAAAVPPTSKPVAAGIR